MIALGAGETESYFMGDDVVTKNSLLFMFHLASIIILIHLLNMLIAIMGDIFNKNSEMY